MASEAPPPTAPLPPALFELVRVAIEPSGAFGVLKHAGTPFAVTLERTYPEPGGLAPKIPKGRHHCTPTWFGRGNYATFEVIVEGHSRILFHKANVALDLDGCIGVGEQFGTLNGQPAILSSAAGFAEFIQLAGSQSFDLDVSEWRDA